MRPAQRAGSAFPEIGEDGRGAGELPETAEASCAQLLVGGGAETVISVAAAQLFAGKAERFETAVDGAAGHSHDEALS